MARVTVALAVYNGSATIAQALDAVFAQTYRDFDVLVLDDGSTDNTTEIVAKYDCRLIQVENAGLGAGRKRLVEEAAGELVAFVDHDDFWLPEKLEKQVRLIDETGASLVHADGWYVYEDGREVARDLRLPADARSFDHILPSNVVIASTAVFSRKAMLDAGNFVADTVRCSDWYGWLILAPGRTFAHLPEKLVRYSVLSTSLANAGYRFHAAQHYLLTHHILPRRQELFGALPADARARYTKMVVRDIGVALSNMAKHKLAQGDRQESRRLAREALRHAPDVARVWTRAIKTFLPR
ncbi:glycosyltransferase [Fimbriimonas ginsengisoli]|uniref:Putative glycosyltransferase n=1 Tax=Fimbriimonas ginsengisoli Gsoil 348 TaxID=661478 RepID=A0A068NUC7_FIMGI|nr:glycosyltransferase [Fimbriimonas ginsengisoli]AIE87031.1 putative glycosyltransferase [Fimbriimonas ginsengisoli Gsoil 348]